MSKVKYSGRMLDRNWQVYFFKILCKALGITYFISYQGHYSWKVEIYINE